VTARTVRRGRAAGVVLALGLSACSCGPGAPPPEPAAEAAPAPPRVEALEVEVVVGSGLDRRGLAGVEVRAVPGDEMDSHLARHEAAAARLGALQDEEARLAVEGARLRAANDASNQAYMVGSADYLRERAALNLQARSAADAAARRRAATERRMAVRFKATESARTALQAEQRLARLARERGELQATLLEQLPEAVAQGTSGPGGALTLSLPPGRYAVVGRTPEGAGRAVRSWLGWVVVKEGEQPRLLLDDAGAQFPGADGGGSR